ncbi:hypothetical protein Psch_04130 [Pelotomaculum schinkii]|uniref:DUF5316 domain-containing protein n=2 Tax=Pelotomaculum TaxID=191373 RepID=A0A4Y7R6L5_9FIRM|nr:DUF5316 domain-containing protein [Pelotomaculum schinkii]TEB04403.1 hypothetical protein Psch_04130 [Pelotomaculum schinkii]TEB15250.1 hypothetical protein Psfp_02287 [Pelotomaculum sp. FP]
MRSFIIGLVIAISGLVVSLFLDNPNMVVNGLLMVGVVPMVLAAIFSGALVSGDRVRANYSDEQDFRQRMRWSTNLFLFGIPNLLASLAIYSING